ncbi:class I SAM-dependent methyltransferase [Roseiconus lacunae]|uniref:class I SAM-dependent methyltransferase n=1 Tax=Roseiconus lacunae TaxID=2605694 RepID=UPI001E2B37BD|nr:class I SAM-dependent methyltransferase [Roseiconus lacunae]MCD0463257.1 class I SAM-dependent methyltransferase [Roseiconus lacunae]
MTQDSMPPDRLRPNGVAPGTWRYIHQRTIARHYDDFVEDTPLCKLDHDYVITHLGKAAAAPGSEKKCETNSPLLLDLGCGTGRLAFPACGLGFDVLAIDLSQHMLMQLAERTATVQGTIASTATDSSVYPLRASLVELGGIRDEIADHAVCMFSTLGMIAGRQNRVDCLRHIHRILRPGGKFLFHVHRRWAALREPGGFKQLTQSWLRSHRQRDADFGDWTYAYRGLPNMFMHRFNQHELRHLVRASGFRIDRLDRIKLDGSGLTQSRWNSGGYFVVCSKPDTKDSLSAKASASK